VSFPTYVVELAHHHDRLVADPVDSSLAAGVTNRIIQMVTAILFDHGVRHLVFSMMKDKTARETVRIWNPYGERAYELDVEVNQALEQWKLWLWTGEQDSDKSWAS
jgi:hypothetical protein